MSNAHLPGAEKLGKQLCLALPEKKFISTFAVKVGDELDSVQVFRSEQNGDRWFHYLGGGLVVVDTGGLWFLYETAEQTAEYTHLAAWQDFARGFWTAKVPTNPGVYPTRDKKHNRCKDRTIIRVDKDTLKDVSGGFVRAGKVTEWVGDWYSLPYPPLPGAV